MASITIDQTICRNKTTITSAINDNGNIDTTVVTLCSEVDKIMHVIPQDVAPQRVMEVKYDILPELFLTCPTVPGAGCPFICVTYQAIESEAIQAINQTEK